MDYKPRPNIEGKKLDFSEFHPIDHSLIACTGYPGGRRRHLKHRWQFQWRSAIRSRTTCLIGLHRPGQTWSRSATWISCVHCWKKLSEPQQD